MGSVLPLNFFQKFLVRTFFEGAKRTTATRDFANASNQNFEELAKTDRDTLRARARWLSANNPIMSNIDATIINNTIGRGIELQLEDPKLQERWDAWCQVCDLTGRRVFGDMQRLILKTRMVDAEIYTYKKPTKEGLRLQLIEADQLDTYAGESGLELDSDGKVTAYHFKTDSGSQKIDAKYIINYHKSNRVSQYRGVSEYSRSVIDIKNFQGFTTANIQSLRARANIAYVVAGNEIDPSAHGVTTAENEQIQEINGAFVHYLNQGETITAVDSSTTPINYAEFVESTVRMISTGRNISYELAFRDFSKVNFSSQKASIIQDNKRFDAEQHHITTYHLENIFKTWYEYEVLNGRDSTEVPKRTWITPVREWVQPEKELDVLLKKIDNNLATPEDASKALGLDYEYTLTRKKENLDMAKRILGEHYMPAVTQEVRSFDEESFFERLHEVMSEREIQTKQGGN